MPKISSDLKAKLIEEGRWTEFVRYRQDLKAGGSSSVTAHKAAVDHFFNNAPEKSSESGSVNPKSAQSATESAQSVEKRRPIPDVPADVRSGSSSKPAEPTVKTGGSDYAELPPVQSSDFEGRVANEVDVIRWVAANMEIQDPNPADCPSSSAWGLLAHCRSSNVARSEFWKQTYPKLLPSRAKMEEQQEVDNEGKAAEVIEDLLRFRTESESDEE